MWFWLTAEAVLLILVVFCWAAAYFLYQQQKLTAALCVLLPPLLLALLLCAEHYYREREQCLENLQLLANGAELYAQGQEFHWFPAQLSDLQPDYLEELPTCNGVSYRYEVTSPEAEDAVFTISCQGDRHWPLPRPQYVYGKGFQNEQ